MVLDTTVPECKMEEQLTAWKTKEENFWIDPATLSDLYPLAQFLFVQNATALYLFVY